MCLPGEVAHVSDVETGSTISLAGIVEVDALGETSVSPRVVEASALWGIRSSQG